MVTPVNAPNVTGWATMFNNATSVLTVRGAFAGDGVDCNLRVSSHDNTDVDLNAGSFIQGTLEWATGGASTWKWQEWAQANAGSVTATPDRDIDESGGNLKIQGLAQPTADNDAANKAYVDSKVNNMFDILDPVQTISDGDQTPTYDGVAGTVVVNTGTAGNFTTPLTGPERITCDGFELNASLSSLQKRILFRGSKGAAVGTGNDSDGLYELTSVVSDGGGQFNVTFTRVLLLPQTAPITKGKFVLINGNTANAKGNGYVLNADVADQNAPEPWILFSTQHELNFIAPIENIAGDYTVAGDSGGAQQFLPLVAGSGGASGVASFSSTVGNSAQTFDLHGTTITLNDATAVVVNATTSVTITAPTTVFTAATTLTFDATGGTSELYGDTHIFGNSESDAGTQPTAGLPTYATVKQLGCVAPTTTEFAVAAAATVGNGILFDTKTDFAGTNTNEGVFYLAPHYAGSSATAAGSVTLDIVKFATGASGAGTVIAQLIP